MRPDSIARPLGVGELLDIAFRLYRRHLTTLLLISAIGIVPLAIVQILLTLAPIVGAFANNLLTLAVVPLVSGALSAAGAGFLAGREPTPGEAYAAARGRWLSLVGAIFVQGLILAGPFLVIGACLLVFASRGRFDVGSSFAFMLGALIVALLTLPLLLLLATRYAVVIPVAVLERANAAPSMRRSWGLTKGQFGHTLGVVLSAGLLVFLIGQLPAYLLIWGATFAIGISGQGQAMLAATIGGAALSQLGLLVTLPFQYLVMTLLYHDLRVRTEALDLEQRMREVVS